MHIQAYRDEFSEFTRPSLLGILPGFNFVDEPVLHRTIYEYIYQRKLKSGQIFNSELLLIFNYAYLIFQTDLQKLN